MSRSLTNFHQEQKILLLSIIISETSYKRILSRYTILIQENKQQTFSLFHSMKHYSYIYKENELDGKLKNLIFVLIPGVLEYKKQLKLATLTTALT